jgi:NAD(P)-dependent dehydrogenase (short-subunit alcohol dehydrogenase family)
VPHAAEGNARRLEGKVAVITGGGSGIGRATAFLFATEGASVMVGDRDEGSGQETVARVTSTGGRAAFRHCDVSKASDVAALMEAATQSFGGLHVVFNNAGIWAEEDGPSPLLREDVWDRVIEVNLKGTYLGCKYAIPLMNEGGSIINMASVAALRAGKDNTDAYAASKGGILALTRFVAVEYGRRGIRCNCIAPGSIMTPMTARSYEDPQIRQYWHDHTALRRVGQPEEVARVALFLASDESSYITGQVLVVDGGYMAR